MPQWKEEKDEAHEVDCVVVSIPMPRGTGPRDVRSVLTPKALRIYVKGELHFSDGFAEEHWLSLDESYWELSSGTPPMLQYFLAKNAEFQREPLYCLFFSELQAPPEPDSDTDEAVEDEQPQHLEAAPRAGAAPGTAAAEATEDRTNTAATASQAGAQEVAVASAEASASAAGAHGCNNRLEEDRQDSHENAALVSNAAPGATIAEATKEPANAEATSSEAGPQGCDDYQERLAAVVLEAAKLLGRPQGHRCTLWLWSPSEQDAATLGFLRGQWRRLLGAGLSHLEIVVLSFCDIRPPKLPADLQESTTLRWLNMTDAACTELLFSADLPDIAHIPVGLLEHQYFAAMEVLYHLAKSNVLMVLSESPSAQWSPASLESSGAGLKNLGCQVAAPPQIQGMTKFIFVRGLEADSVLTGHGDVTLRAYPFLKRALAGIGLDFRPSHPHFSASDRPRAAARGAKLVAEGMDLRGAAAAAAGVCAAEAALAELSEGVPPNVRVEVATAWGARVALESGGSDHVASAVGALLGLLEGLYAWDGVRPLDGHGAEVAAIMAQALAGESLWRSFSDDVRRRKIMDLARAGGLSRPGECTIALCQALLGMNRPAGASRVQGALNVLQKVASLLLVQASLPNLLQPGSEEVSVFCRVALDNLNVARLRTFLLADRHGVDKAE